MKLLLINNDSDTLQQLEDLCRRCDFSVDTVHCSKVSQITPDHYDLIVLSGGWWYDDELKNLEVYAQELELIRHTTVPTLGICIGMQLMHIAEGHGVPLLDQRQTGTRQIAITPDGQKLLDLPPVIEVHKNHSHGVLEPAPDYMVLATSPGYIEIMMHVNRPLLGVQFHPEIGDPAAMDMLFRKLVAAVMQRSAAPLQVADTA